MERDSVRVHRPLCVERYAAVCCSRQVFHFLVIRIGSAAAVGRCIPPGEGVAGAGEAVAREILGGVVGEGLVGHGTAIAAVGVKFHSVAVGRPGGGVVAVAGAARCDGDGGTGLREPRSRPPGKDVAGSGGIVQGYCLALHGIARGVAGRSAASQVIVDGIGVDRPLSVEGDGTVLFRGEVIHIGTVPIGVTSAVGRRVPPDEGVAGAGEAVGGEILGDVIGEILVVHGAAAAVRIEVHSVGVGLHGDFPVVPQSHMIACPIREEIVRWVFTLHMVAPPTGEGAGGFRGHADGSSW